MPRRRRDTPVDAFRDAVRQALEHLEDPGWLEEHSVLATAYFLARSDRSVDSARDQLAARLQGLLSETHRAMWPGDLPADLQAMLAALLEAERDQGQYHFALLDLRYFRRVVRPRAKPLPTDYDEIAWQLGISKSSYYSHLNEAIEALGRAILSRIRPSFQAEQLPVQEHIVGRDLVVARCRSHLQARQTVALSGPAGVGKTAVGAACYKAWHGPRLWVTIRPALNDNLSSLLFSLGDRCQQAGQSSLWLHLQASGGRIDNPEETLGLLRDDLRRLFAGELLLCLDELDRLESDSDRPNLQSHLQLIEFVEGLRGEIPLLLIGQRAIVDADRHYVLSPLTREDTVEWLKRVEPGQAAAGGEIHELSEGNPRRLELCLALLRAGDPLESLRRLAEKRRSEPLFYRLWRRLSDDEKEVLQALSVYRQTAPADLWQESGPVIQRLRDRFLVHDEAGGLVVHEFYRLMVYRRAPANRRVAFHGLAAKARAGRGQYTAALYHFARAGQNDMAVQIWYAHRDFEIARGQAHAALSVLEGISDVSRATRDLLDVARSQLRLFHGQVEMVIDDLSARSTRSDQGFIAPELNVLWGDALHITGRREAALGKYEQALDQLGTLFAERSALIFRRAQIYMELNDHRKMEAMLGHVEYELARIRGFVAGVSSRFDESEVYFKDALARAETLQDARFMAEAHRWLAMVTGSTGRIEEAEAHTEIAIDYFRGIGARASVEALRAELAGLYIQAKRFPDVIEPGERALAYFQERGYESRTATILTNLAEAYLECGQEEKAWHRANQALRTEHEGSRPYALYTIGKIEAGRGRAEESVKIFEEALAQAQENKDKKVEPYLWREIGRVRLHSRQSAAAEEALQVALDQFVDLGLKLEVQETVELLGQARMRDDRVS